MKSYDLYGISGSSLNSVRTVIESLLNIRMHERESDYRCGDYFRFGNDEEENFILQRNYDEFDEEWVEEDFVEIPFLLYVNETVRSEELRSILTCDDHIKLLRHE